METAFCYNQVSRPIKDAGEVGMKKLSGNLGALGNLTRLMTRVRPDMPYVKEDPTTGKLEFVEPGRQKEQPMQGPAQSRPVPA